MMATRNMKYYRKTYGLMSQDASQAIDKLFRQARPQPRKPRSDRKYPSNAARQAAWRARKAAKLAAGPLGPEQWDILGSAISDGLQALWEGKGRRGVERMREIQTAANALVSFHHVGVEFTLNIPEESPPPMAKYRFDDEDF
jgi:hypothetical protein